MMKTATVNLTLICLGYRKRLWFSSGAEVSSPSFSDVFSYDGGHFQINIQLLNFKIQLVFIRKKVLLNLNMLNTV
jgi:hypothetical protein